MDEYLALVASWRRSLRARNLARKTLITYVASAEQLHDWLADHDVTAVADISSGHVEAFIGHLLDTRSASTASVRFRALQQRLFLDTGLRLGELAGLRVADVDLDERPAVVFAERAKGRRPRAVPVGARTESILDRYLRARAREKRADLPALWLGSNGRVGMTDNGISQTVRKRGRAAGLPDLHPHVLRHSWAHEMRVAGVDDDALMSLAGWKSRSMLNRYGASAASERARAARGRAQLPTDRL